MKALSPGDESAFGSASGAWRRSFNRFWLSQSLSQFAAHTALAALPLVALTNLQVPSASVGLISFAQYVPVLLFTLLFGALIDTTTKSTPILIGHFGRAATFGVLTVLAATGSLNFPALIIAVFAAGCLTAAFDVAVQALVPAVVPRDALMFANSRIQLTYSAAQVLGPALGGVAAGLDRPAIAFGSIALGYTVAGTTFFMARIHESRPPKDHARRFDVFRKMAEGIAFSIKDPVLGTLLVAGAVFNLLEQSLITTLMVHATRELTIPTAALGVALGTTGLGAVLAALFASRLKRRNRAKTMGFWMCLATLSPVALTGVNGNTVYDQLILAGVFFTYGSGLVVYNVLAVSLRQERAPASMLGRVGAVYRFFAYGALALGGLVSAALIATVGSQNALYLIIGAMALSAVLYAVRLVQVRDDINAAQ
jgi:MFS family permease